MSEEGMKCPICFGGGYLIHRGTRDNPKIDVFKCNNCGTKFLSDNGQQRDYENGFMYDDIDPMSALNIEQRLQIFQTDDERRYNMVKEICRGKSVLDFGCGFGGFLSRISEIADVCCGVDLGREERLFLNRKGIRCLRTIEDVSGTYDVITLFHTFEHLDNPRMWLDKFSNYLASGGYLIIEVPHADDALLSLYESEKFADFTYWSAHLFLYTMKSLSMLIEESGEYSIEAAEQVQRYSIANHLHWLAKGRPGGHHNWDFIDDEELNRAYTRKLQELQMCDTIFLYIRKKL